MNNESPVPTSWVKMPAPQPISAMRRLVNSIEAGRVQRYHNAPTVQAQSDGQHMWGVALIILYLTGGIPSRTLLIEAIMHDVAEIDNGDIPFATKRKPGVKELFDALDEQARTECHVVGNLSLTANEKALLKIADTLEGYVWACKTEVGFTPDGDTICSRWEKHFHIGLEKFRAVLEPSQFQLAADLFGYFYRR